MTFNVEIVLKGRDVAVTETLSVDHGAPASWNDGAVRDVLSAMLRAIDRAEHPQAAPGRPVVLQGFSWIVESVEGGVVIALEIPMGAAVAGPFEVDQQQLSVLITHVLKAERLMALPGTVH